MMKIGLAFPAFYQNFVEAFPEDNIITYDIFEEVPVELMSAPPENTINSTGTSSKI